MITGFITNGFRQLLTLTITLSIIAVGLTFFAHQALAQSSSENFTATPRSGNAPLSVSFSARAVDSSATYSVEFGDGNEGSFTLSELANSTVNNLLANHTYSTPGTYTAKLMKYSCPAGGSISCAQVMQTVSQLTITVGQGTTNQSENFTASPRSGDAPLHVLFQANTVGTTVSSYTIDFGDGSDGKLQHDDTAVPSTGSGVGSGGDRMLATHIYSTPGTYTAKLLVNRPCPVGVSCTQALDTVGEVTITVGQPTSTPNPGSSGDPIIESFTGPATLKKGVAGTWEIKASDPQNDPLTYNMDWGDRKGVLGSLLKNVVRLVRGSYVQTSTFTHTYSTIGTYTVTATVRDKNGNTTVKTTTVQVTDSGDSVALTAKPASGKAPLKVTLDGHTTTAFKGGTAIDPGDGSSRRVCNQPDASGKCSISHTYNAVGTYTARLIGTSDGSETILGTVTVTTKKSNIVANFFSSIAGAFRNTFDKVADFLFKDRKAGVRSSGFADLPITNIDTYTPGSRTIDEIAAIVINRTPTGTFDCNLGAGPNKYEAYVITTTNEIGVSDCATGTNVSDYVATLVNNLSVRHSFKELTIAGVLEKPIYLGSAGGDLASIIGTPSNTPTSTPIVNKDIGLEVKIKDKDDKTVIDWSRLNITMRSTDKLYFRWDASEFSQCLPFFNDNGNYALTRGSTKMTTGNTETEGFFITTRTGSYYVECAGNADGSDVHTGIIHVNIDNTIGQPVGTDIASNSFAIEVDDSNPLKVNVTRTVTGESCGPKFVGEITWGDGSVTKQPDVVTLECGNHTTFTQSHTYAQGGTYNLSIKLDNTVRFRKTLTLSGTASSKLMAAPTSGAIPLRVIFTANKDPEYPDSTYIDFGDGSSRKACTTLPGHGTCGAIHTYNQNGLFKAQLLGAKSSSILSIGSGSTVVLAEQLIKTGTYASVGDNAALTATPTTGASPLRVRFTIRHNEPGTATLSFGDGTQSFVSNWNGTGSNTRVNEHTYSRGGTYTARLASGCAAGSTSAGVVAAIGIGQNSSSACGGALSQIQSVVINVGDGNDLHSCVLSSNVASCIEKYKTNSPGSGGGATAIGGSGGSAQGGSNNYNAPWVAIGGGDSGAGFGGGDMGGGGGGNNSGQTGAGANTGGANRGGGGPSFGGVDVGGVAGMVGAAAGVASSLGVPGADTVGAVAGMVGGLAGMFGGGGGETGK